MPKAKAARFSRRKSHTTSVRKARDEDDANITFPEFKALAVVSSLTKMGSTKNHKMTFRPGDYARFFNVNLEGREDDIQDSEYWVGQIKEIRRSTTDPGTWIHVKWLWAPDEVKALNDKLDISHMGEYERIFCHATSQSETVVHSDTIEGPTKVYTFDEHVNRIPDTDAFYVRSTFDYGQKSLAYLNKEADCTCIGCDITYNPDDSQDSPLRYCATCQIWCHTGCGSKARRLVKSVEFSNKEHHAKGLLLSLPTVETVRPGPKSVKAHKVAKNAIHVDLHLVDKRVPKRFMLQLIALAQTRIVRPLPGNIAGNKSYVMQAREWVREARTKGGWPKDRTGRLEEWFDELTQEINIEQLLASDSREDAKRSALFVCSECGYPV